MSAEELDELLQRVKMRGSTHNSFLLLNPEQRAAIARVILPEIQKLIEQARAREEA